MAGLRRARILGTGMHVPDRVVSNRELEQWMDTSDEWIQQRSGIRERRYADSGLGPSDLAVEASRNALDMAKTKPEELDLVLFATLSPDYYFPGSSVFLQDKLGLSTTPAMDIRCQCSGFLYALNVAQLFVASGQYNRVLVAGAEAHSRALDFSTAGRQVAVLFGDGAGAVVVGPSEDENRGILDVRLHAEGRYRDELKIEAPSTRHMPYISKEALDEGLHWPHMEGRQVFKHAVTRMPEVVRETLGAQNVDADDVDLYLFHQANLRINEAALKQLGQPPAKTYNNIDRYGNCSAASIPMLLDECVRGDRVQEGTLICMAGFGAGFTWAGALMRW